MTFNYLKSSLARNFPIYERNEKRSCGREELRQSREIAGHLIIILQAFNVDLLFLLFARFARDGM